MPNRNGTKKKRKPVVPDFCSAEKATQSDQEDVSASRGAEVQINAESESGLEDEEGETEPALSNEQVLEPDEDVEENEAHRNTNDVQVDLNPGEATLDENGTSIKDKSQSFNNRNKGVSNSPSPKT